MRELNPMNFSFRHLVSSVAIVALLTVCGCSEKTSEPAPTQTPKATPTAVVTPPEPVEVDEPPSVEATPYQRSHQELKGKDPFRK